MMRKVYLILALLLLAVMPVFADGSEDPIVIERLEDMDFLLASIDNLFIPVFNPALCGTGHSDGFGWAQVYDAKKLQKQYWLFANLGGLNYVYEYDKLNQGRSVNYHTLASGSEQLPRHIFPNLYFGSSYRWKNSNIRKGDCRSGFTYRPTDSASVGFTWDNPYGKKPEYRFGAAIRPLALIPSAAGHRLELSADVDYRREDGSYKVKKPTLGVQTQLLDGVNIGGSYNLESETAQLSFSLSFGKTDLGALNRMKGKGRYAIPYIHLTNKTYLPFLGIKPNNWYDMSLKGSIVSYKAPKYELGPVKVYDKNTVSIETLTATLKQAAQDPAVSGIMLRNPSFSSSFALMEELLAAVKEFKASGKKISAYYDNISNGGYFFASSVADSIYLNPMGGVDLRGLSVKSPYFGDLLKSLGVDVINLRSHRYKSAGNMFSESEMTEAEREVYESLLQSIYDEVLASIQSGRGPRLAKGVAETIDAGPYFLAKDALKAGLVDALIYEGDLDERLEEGFGISGHQSGLADYREYNWAKPRQDLVVVIYASGNIVMGEGTPGKSIAHKSTVELIREARKNKAYKGIILRVDSGGGSAQASDIILNELALAQSENKKPVVVSMAGAAASGGYYISCKADKIVAEPSTLTGSIGVIGLAFNTRRLMDKAKVNWSTVNKGKNADFGSMTRDWSEEEKARMTHAIEALYDEFVGIVDAGRDNLTLEQVHEIAQGRVWTGKQAYQIGLVDALGGLETARAEMRELAGLKGEVTLVNATTKPGGIDVQMGGNPFMGLPVLGLLEDMGGDYIKAYELWKDLQGEEILMLAPINAGSIQF